MKGWPTLLSIGASLTLALIILWPHSEIQPDQLERDKTSTPKKNIPADILTDAASETSQASVPVLLPPPPRRKKLTEWKTNPQGDSAPQVTALKPLDVTSSEASSKPLNVLKPSKQTGVETPPLLNPLPKEKEVLAETIRSKVKPLTPLTSEERTAPRAVTPLRETTSKAANSPVRHKTAVEIPDNNSRQDLNSLSSGRALLRILEHGKGPEIDIAWPNHQAARDKLFRLLRRCYGMHVAVMSRDNILYRLSDPAGQPWQLNMDRLSGFIRLIGGKISNSERQLIRRLKRLHYSIKMPTPVRLFPRNFDGALLGGLSKFLTKNKASLRSISAQYQSDGHKLWVEDIRVNGKPIEGLVDLTTTSSCKRFPRMI